MVLLEVLRGGDGHAMAVDRYLHDVHVIHLFRWLRTTLE